MATTSKQIDTLDAEPTQVVEPGVLGGRVRTAFFELDLGGEGSNTVFDLIDLPPNAVLKRIELRQTTSSSTNLDIGDSNDADAIIDGQAVDQNLTVSMANVGNTGTNGMDPADFGKQLWEVLGYSSRIAAGSKIRLQATNPSAAVSSAKLFGVIEYVLD